MNQRKTRKARKYIIIVLLCLVAAAFLLPMFWLALNSLKSNKEINFDSFALPTQIRWSNYTIAIKKFDIVRYFANSVFVTAMVILLSVTLTLLMAYSFAKMDWKLSRLTYSFILAGYFIPSAVTFVATYQVIRGLHIFNTRLAVILPYAASNIVSGTLLFYAFIRSIPSELEESIVLDGGGILHILRHLIIPLTKPVMATVSISAFINCWSEYLLASLVLQNEKIKTLSLGFQTFANLHSTDYGPLYAAMIITSIAPLVVFFWASKNIQNVFAAGVSLK